MRPLANYVNRAFDSGSRLRLDPVLAQRYAGALHIVDADDERAMASCFTSAYGRSVVRSGSYLRTPAGLRRFAPAEIQSLLGFPTSFRWPEAVSVEQAWRLLGQSLSITVVRRLLAPICSPTRSLAATPAI
jgi:hypothetical protein